MVRRATALLVLLLVVACAPSAKGRPRLDSAWSGDGILPLGVGRETAGLNGSLLISRDGGLQVISSSAAQLVRARVLPDGSPAPGSVYAVGDLMPTSPSDSLDVRGAIARADGSVITSFVDLPDSNEELFLPPCLAQIDVADQTRTFGCGRLPSIAAIVPSGQNSVLALRADGQRKAQLLRLRDDGTVDPAFGAGGATRLTRFTTFDARLLALEDGRTVATGARLLPVPAGSDEVRGQPEIVRVLADGST